MVSMHFCLLFLFIKKKKKNVSKKSNLSNLNLFTCIYQRMFIIAQYWQPHEASQAFPLVLHIINEPAEHSLMNWTMSLRVWVIFNQLNFQQTVGDGGRSVLWWCTHQPILFIYIWLRVYKTTYINKSAGTGSFFFPRVRFNVGKCLSFLRNCSCDSTGYPAFIFFLTTNILKYGETYSKDAIIQTED